MVGFGRIGRAVARRAGGFGMQVVFTDPTPIPSPDPPAVQLPLDDLLAASRVVTLHAPLDAEHPPPARRASGCGRCGRGRSWSTPRAGRWWTRRRWSRVLEEGHLAGAGLDVYEHEPEVHPGLLPPTDVVLLPHVGSATLETRAAMAELAATNLVAVLEGREPPTPVVRGR